MTGIITPNSQTIQLEIEGQPKITIKPYTFAFSVVPELQDESQNVRLARDFCYEFGYHSGRNKAYTRGGYIATEYGDGADFVMRAAGGTWENPQRWPTGFQTGKLYAVPYGNEFTDESGQVQSGFFARRPGGGIYEGFIGYLGWYPFGPPTDYHRSGTFQLATGNRYGGSVVNGVLQVPNVLPRIGVDPRGRLLIYGRTAGDGGNAGLGVINDTASNEPYATPTYDYDAIGTGYLHIFAPDGPTTGTPVISLRHSRMLADVGLANVAKYGFDIMTESMSQVDDGRLDIMAVNNLGRFPIMTLTRKDQNIGIGTLFPTAKFHIACQSPTGSVFKLAGPSGIPTMEIFSDFRTVFNGPVTMRDFSGLSYTLNGLRANVMLQSTPAFSLPIKLENGETYYVPAYKKQ